jgi:excisionase family DNA binding protein
MTTVQFTATDKILSFIEVMDILGISRPTLHRRIKDGSIKATRLQRKVYFKYSDLMAMKEPQPIGEAAKES